MQGLVIDLRGNPGGVGAMSIPIAHMFVEGGTSLGRLQMREFNQEFTVAPNPSAFTGPIAILVDEGTASTSEIFALGMRDIGRVTIVGGGPSAGMALPSMIETLPDGGLIQYVVGDYHSAKGTAAEGEGVQPDVRVSESRADFAANRDPAFYPDPDRFDIHRANANKHLSFAYGPHYCIGAALALLEGEIGLAALFARFPNLQRHPNHPAAPQGHEFRATPTLFVTW